MILAVATGACAESSASKNEHFTLHTGLGSQQLAMSSNGQIIGPNMQLSPTPAGYRGMANSAMVDLRSDGQHIVGTINDRVVDLHVSINGDQLRAQGMFGGRLGRIEASNSAINSNLGYCTYELEVKGAHYEGQRACGRGGMAIPRVYPVAIEFPPGFGQLRADRQAMLLAILLGQ